MIRRWLLRRLLPDQVYVAVRVYSSPMAVTVEPFDVHTDFDGANEELARKDVYDHAVEVREMVKSVRLVID